MEAPSPPPTAADLAIGVKARLAAERQKVRSALTNRSLSIPARDGLPEKLAEQLAEFNAMAEEFAGRTAAFDEAVAELVGRMADGTIRGADIALTASEIRATAYDMAQAWVSLLEARQPILTAVAEHIRNIEVPKCEKTLAGVMKKAEKALRGARRGPEDRAAWRQGARDVAERQFAFEVRQHPEVAAAAAALKALRDEVSHLAAQARAVPKDSRIVGEAVVKAFCHLAPGIL